MSNNQKDLIKEARIKAARFCSYRERAPEEVRQKLIKQGLNDSQVEDMLQELIDDNFINEQRFATAYANGKLRINKWGRIKIRQGLERHLVDPTCMEKALHSLEEAEYRAIMISLIQKKHHSLKITDPFIRNHKIAQFVISKGFEPDLVWQSLKSDL